MRLNYCCFKFLVFIETNFSLTAIKDVHTLISELTSVTSSRASVTMVNLLPQAQSPSQSQGAVVNPSVFCTAELLKNSRDAQQLYSS
jgi:hypothetical protein